MVTATTGVRAFVEQQVPKYGRRRGHFFWSVVWVGIAGCSGGGDTLPVTGTVKLPDGTPINGGLVLFHPLGPDQKAARGSLAPDGSFQLSTSKLNDGAAPGDYKVVVNAEPPIEVIDDPAKRAAYRSPLDTSYQSLETTPLTYTVSADENNHFDIVVQPPGARLR